ncbi:MAG: hypothetical protein ACYCVZ_18300 [Streptosporangiaceae bacterium]
MDSGIRIGTGLRTWPRRRWVAAGAAFPVLVIIFAVAGGGLASTASTWWTWPWLILTSALASVVLASYLARPGTGKAIEVGCSPCAAAAGVALVAALMAHASAPASPFMAVVATGLTALALRQRLTDASSCPAPARAGRPVAGTTARIADPGAPGASGAQDEPTTPAGTAR